MTASTASALPLVSIGIPVYNEEAFLEQALASLVAQDYPNIEFILADNASTDATEDICKHAASADSRIRVLNAETNLGSAANFTRCLDEAHGEFFMWAAGHDQWSSNLISQCVAALQTHHGALIAVPESCWIDAESKQLNRQASMLDTRGMEPLARLFTLLWANMHPIYGLMRTKALRAAGPIPNYSGSDLILLARLLLDGDCVPASSALWSRRQIRPLETMQDRQQRYRGSQFKLGKSLFPLARLTFEILRTTWKSKLSLADKLAFTVALPWMLPARYLVARRRVA